jgi:capsid protein
MEIKIFGKSVFSVTPTSEKEQATPEAFSTGGTSYNGYGGQANQVFAVPFDGEKDLGEMGQIRRYIIDYNRLRYRSWQLYLESDVCQALFQRSAIWNIGRGLKLQCEPVMPVLETEKIEFDAEDFNEAMESRFRVYANSAMCDYEGKRNLHDIMTDTWINQDVAGDVLIVLRLVNGMPKVKIIDAANVATPLGFGTADGLDTVNPKTGCVIRNGIETDKRGKHVAYWVRKSSLAINVFDFERIAARMDRYPYSEMARLVYGSKYRLDNNRGIPLITAVMETASKMGRYREATLGGAEERAKVVYSVEHKAFSDGSNPGVQSITKAAGLWPADMPTDSYGKNLANNIQATTNKMTYNMPLGAELKALESKQENNFKDFYSVNFDIVCAVAGYPPEVILSKYDSNYSASRAAIKDFEHTLLVKRDKFAKQTYQIVYNFCFDVWALSGVIDAPGYLQALADQNEMVLAAYRNARWEGDAVPHIDPYKEVQAIRAMLGEDAANFPLCTMEQAIERLGNGDYSSVLEQYSDEIEEGIKEGLTLVEPKLPQPTQPNGNPAKKESDK